MALRLRSAAKRSAQGVPGNRRKSVPKSSPLRSRFRRTRPRVTARVSPTVPRARGGGFSPSGLSVMLQFSTELVSRRIGGNYVSEDQLERWAAIQSGHLPSDWQEDPDAPVNMMTVEQAEEVEAERLAEVEAAGRRREESVREEAEMERRAAHTRADSLDDDANAVQQYDRQEAAQLRRQATLQRERAEESYVERQREMDRIAEEVREEREAVRAELVREVERAEEAVSEFMSRLRAGLDREVENAVKSQYVDADVADWSLI